MNRRDFFSSLGALAALGAMPSVANSQDGPRQITLAEGNPEANAKVILAHPGCPPFAQQAARALDEAALLKAYVTTFSYQPQTRLGRALRSGFLVRVIGRAASLPNIRVSARRIFLTNK